jgi:hypothetical protein
MSLSVPVVQKPNRGDHHRVDPHNEDQMGEINMIFKASMSIALKMQGKKLEQEISLAQRIEPGRKMKWSDVGISFWPEDHLETELSEQNLPFVVKLSIGWHKVAKTLVVNAASLNLIMRKTFIEMGLNLSDLTLCMIRFMALSRDSHPLLLNASTSRYPVEWETINAG